MGEWEHGSMGAWAAAGTCSVAYARVIWPGRPMRGWGLHAQTADAEVSRIEVLRGAEELGDGLGAGIRQWHGVDGD